MIFIDRSNESRHSGNRASKSQPYDPFCESQLLKRAGLLALMCNSDYPLNPFKTLLLSINPQLGFRTKKRSQFVLQCDLLLRRLETTSPLFLVAMSRFFFFETDFIVKRSNKLFLNLFCSITCIYKSLWSLLSGRQTYFSHPILAVSHIEVNQLRLWLI